MIALACALVWLGVIVGMAFESWRHGRHSRRFIIVGTRDALKKLSASQDGGA